MAEGSSPVVLAVQVAALAAKLTRQAAQPRQAKATTAAVPQQLQAPVQVAVLVRPALPEQLHNQAPVVLVQLHQFLA